MTSVVTEEHERQLWEELNSRVADVVPEGTDQDDRERAIMLALMGHDRRSQAIPVIVAVAAFELASGNDVDPS